MGTALSSNQLLSAARLSGGRVVLALDNDEAGQQALERLCETVLPTLGLATAAAAAGGVTPTSAAGVGGFDTMSSAQSPLSSSSSSPSNVVMDLDIRIGSLDSLNGGFGGGGHGVKDAGQLLQERGLASGTAAFSAAVVEQSVAWSEWYAAERVLGRGRRGGGSSSMDANSFRSKVNKLTDLMGKMPHAHDRTFHAYRFAQVRAHRCLISLNPLLLSFSSSTSFEPKRPHNPPVSPSYCCFHPSLLPVHIMPCVRHSKLSLSLFLFCSLFILL